MRSPDLYTDEQWLELMIEGLERYVDGVPGGPSVELQARFVGRAGAAAMRDCFPFYQLTKRQVREPIARQIDANRKQLMPEYFRLWKSPETRQAIHGYVEQRLN